MKPKHQQTPSGLLTFRTIFTSLLALGLLACEQASAPSLSFETAVKGLHSAAISEDGRYSIMGSIHHGGSLWRISDQQKLYCWNHTKVDCSNASGTDFTNIDFTTIVASDFSPEGQWAVTADTQDLVLWEVSSGRALSFWTAPGEVLDVALSIGGRYALMGLDNHAAVLFDTKKTAIARILKLKGRVRSVDLSRSGQLAITGSEDYTATVWDLSNGKPVASYQHGDEVQMVSLSPDGKLALSASKYDKAVVWNSRTGKTLGELPLTAEKLKRGLRFTAARFSDNSKLLLTGRPDQEVQLWNTRNFKELKRWKLPKRDAWKPTSSAVIAVAFDKNGKSFYAVGSNGFVHKLRQ